VTASLLIQSDYFMEEKIMLVIHLAYESRHTVGSCRGNRGFTKGVTGSHICWADRYCWICQHKVNVRL